LRQWHCALAANLSILLRDSIILSFLRYFSALPDFLSTQYVTTVAVYVPALLAFPLKSTFDIPVSLLSLLFPTFMA